MSRSNRGDAARAVFASTTFLTLVAGLGLALSTGGCPGAGHSGSSILGEVVEATAVDAGNAAPEVLDAAFATMQDTPISVTLGGKSAGNRALEFIIEKEPDRGTLNVVQPIDGSSAIVRFTPESGYAGPAGFMYRVWDGRNDSPPATVSIAVYPEVHFSVTADQETDDVTLTALAFTANPKYALPDGTYAWAFDDEVFSGPVSSNQRFTHAFPGGDMHTVTLTLTLAGIVLPIPCRFAIDPALHGVIAGPNPFAATVQATQRTRLIRAGDSWRYLKGLANTPPANWKQTTFNDSVWLSGPTGIGYGDNDDATVLSDMINSYRTVYTRRSFSVQNPAAISALTLRIVYDDGFIAYLNGVEVARRNLGAPLSAVTRDTEAEHSIEPGNPEEISISAASLVAGGNVLAIEIHNSALVSSDLSLIPELLVGAPQGPPGFAISGTIRDGNGQPITGVTLTVTGQANQSNGPDGSFSIPLPGGWSGSVTPSKPEYSFIPVGRMYSNLSSIQSGEDFSGMHLAGQVVITGTIAANGGAPISGAVVEFSGQGTAITGPDGVYTKTVRAGWFGRVTPGMSGYSFVPESRSYFAVNGDQNGQNFAGTVVTGPAISGVVTLRPTAGARPMIGPVTLRFTGSNGHPDYSVTSGVDGAYSRIVNSGWVGTISSADRTRCLLFPETTTIGTPVTAPLSGQNLQAWVAPIGVPMPEFGIREQAPPPPNPWTGAIPGWHYVDNSHPQATDTNNPNGHPALPRQTIPRTLAAGSVVEVRGGPYAGFGLVNWSGIAQQPIFIRGSGSPRFTSDIALYNDGVGAGATYTIVEGLSLFSLSIDRPCHHVAVRNCDVRGNLTDGGLTVVSYGTLPVNDIVLYNNVIHDNGDYHASFDQDVHGIEIALKAVNIWVLDNEMARNSGDGIQINGGSTNGFANFHHIYVGRNLAHHNKQTGFWSKAAAEVIFSENVSHGHRPGNSSYGAGMGFQYSPTNIWFLFNHIYDCEIGFGVSADADVVNEGHYFVGNLVNNIHTTSAFNSDDAYHPGQAFVMWGYGTKHIIHNTIHETDGGIGFAAGPSCVIADNIISGTRPGTRHILIANPQTASSAIMNHNLLEGNVSISWAGTVYSSLGTFQSATGRGVGCANADPLFVNRGAGDFHLQPGSSGVNGGAAASVYATFLQRYGLDIYVDRDHSPRLLGAARDMGCFER